MSKENKTVQVPLWQLVQFENTLRMVANCLNSKARENCLDRHVMRDWNEVYDLIHDIKPKDITSLGYYSDKGQTPYNRKND